MCREISANQVSPYIFFRFHMAWFAFDVSDNSMYVVPFSLPFHTSYYWLFQYFHNFRRKLSKLFPFQISTFKYDFRSSSFLFLTINIWLVRDWNVERALYSPIGIIVHSKWPCFMLKVIFSMSSVLALIWWNLVLRSIIEKTLASPNMSKISLMSQQWVIYFSDSI